LRIEKADVVAYYRAIAKTILPHLRNRPLSFKRYPDDIGGEFFWEKDAPSFTPAWVKRFPVPRREGGPPIDYIVCNSMRTLVWLASTGAIELHPFLHKVPRVDTPTQVVFDLDPGEGADLRDCARVALLLRDALPRQSFPKVSGSKGIQVHVPLNTSATHEATESYARLVADEMARAHPKRITAKMSKALRRGKVFIDWSQNADYKTTVAPYSLRATGLVAMPVSWDELTATFTPAQALERVRKNGDLFAPVLKLRQKLPNVGQASACPPRDSKRGQDRLKPVLHLPRPGSQSGRRLFLITRTETGNELWLDVRSRFKRFILRPDREGGGQLIAMPAGEFPIDPAYHRAEVPAEWKGRVTIDDSGAYEVIEGSWQRKRLELWFRGTVMAGRWLLESTGEGHRSWRLTPQ
jgi:bifunctional non-homologous end joining protein LigD